MKKFFVLAPILITADFIVTLINQPPEYWQDFSKVNEANPFVFIFIAAHPMFFIIGYFLYLSVALWILKVSGLLFGVIFSAGLIMVHGSTVFMHLVPKIRWIGEYSIIPHFINLTPLILLFIGFILWLAEQPHKHCDNN
ncbi:MAG: hypothetical protein HYT20_00650 [Candidatus Nealsonbacteria bacterium]|nr:hypothetical protein [Candidatus Nealsonbacteria bacterium]